MADRAEGAYERLRRIEAEVKGADLIYEQSGGALVRDMPFADASFLLHRLLNAEQMVKEQQGAVNDAARRWEKIGYERGYEEGYEEGMAAADGIDTREEP